MQIIIDNQEKTPWSFPTTLVTARIAHLETADYALEGDGRFAIERKSLDDFCGTIGTGWERFCREIDRMKDFDARVIIVEGRLIECCFYETDEEELVPPAHNHPMIYPQFVLKQIALLTLRGVSVIFAENAEIAAAQAYAILAARDEELKGLK